MPREDLHNIKYSLSAVLKAARLGNIATLLFTQLLAFVSLRPDLTSLAYSHELPLFVFAQVLIAAGGYIINDYFDIKIDAINKPSGLVVGKTFPPRWAMATHVVLNAIAVGIAAYIDPKIGGCFLLISFLLLYYSASLKRKFLLGNLLVALLMGSSILILLLLDDALLLPWILFYAGFAFYTGLTREIIKDVEDMEGDKAFGCKTLPIVKGYPFTRRLLVVMKMGLFVLLLVASGVFWAVGAPFSALYFMALTVPLALIAVYVRRADTKKEFTNISRAFKLFILAGIISMAIKI